MSGGSFKQVDVKCPYYVSDNSNHKIICEGIIPGTFTQSVFAEKKDYSQQINTYCSGCYWMCEICKAPDEKYEEEE